MATTGKIQYVFLIYLLIRAPFAAFLHLGSIYNYIIVVEVLIYFYIYIHDYLLRDVIKTKPSIVWLCLVLFHSINLIIKDYNEHPQFLIASIFSCYYLMVLTATLCIRNRNKTLKILFIAYILFVLLSFQLVSVDADFENRLRGESMHPNQFAQAAGMGLLVLSYMKFCNKYGWLTIVIFTIPLLTAILGCGSRNGLVLFFIYIVSLITGNLLQKKQTSKQLFLLFLMSVIGYVVITYILDNTMVGERLLSTKAQSEANNLGTGTVLDKMGDRGIYYYIGWFNFIDNPIAGIGLYNFANYNDFPYPIHSEYLIHFTEGGIIASVLYLYFIFNIITILIEYYKNRDKTLGVVLLFMFVAYLVVGVSAREFNINQFYPIIGICLASIYSYKLSVR